MRHKILNEWSGECPFGAIMTDRSAEYRLKIVPRVARLTFFLVKYA